MNARRIRNLRSRWRPLLAYAFVLFVVSVVLFNLITDQLVTRYDRDAARVPGTEILQGMMPRILGDERSACAILFVHGFIGAQSNFNNLPDVVASQGWYVETMRLPGHGTSPRDFERTTADTLLSAVRERVEALNDRYETVVVVAHSMGGAIATIVAEDTPVDGLVLCAPFFGLSWEHVAGIDTRWVIRRAALLVRWVPGRPGNGPVADPEGRKHIECYGWIPTAGALTALELGERANAPETLGAIRSPVLAIHSSGDTVTSFEATKRAVEQMSGADVSTAWLSESDHVIFWDYEKEVVEEQVVQFIKEVSAS